MSRCIDPDVVTDDARFGVIDPVAGEAAYGSFGRGEEASKIVPAVRRCRGAGFLESGVNVAIGLPFVRTSVDHGTAFDIAGRGVADEAGLLEAMRQALEMLTPGRG